MRWLFKEIEYKIIGNYYGEELNIQVNCLASKTKLGKFNIEITAFNPNYEIEIINQSILFCINSHKIYSIIFFFRRRENIVIIKTSDYC